MAHSSGKHAYGICDISGFRYRLNTMKKTWNGLLVGPDMYDPEALLNPRPDVKSTISLGIVKVHNPKNNLGVSSPIMNALTSNTIGSSFSGREAQGEVGEVSITT